MLEMIQKVGSDTINTINTKHPSLFKIHEEKKIFKGPAERIKSGRARKKVYTKTVDVSTS